ncbi:MAG: phosphoribosyltransferase [Symploca sp. SIO2C1]|nr:phosphoribosyltransferase [Symploca sp. SIO2C1]
MSPAPLFSDRADAGEQLAQSLSKLVIQFQKTTTIACKPIVYALPRGGIPIAAPVARKLGCPLEIVVAKKITTPQNPELAIGAVTSDGRVLWSKQLRLGKKNLSQREAALHQAQEKAKTQLAELEVGYPRANPQGALALLIDDGIATGMTIKAAAQAIRANYPAQLWICAPVAPGGIMKWLAPECDRLVVLKTPTQFLSVSRFYLEFPQVTTKEALVYLQEHNYYLNTINSE